jgi:hypothetical protein
MEKNYRPIKFQRAVGLELYREAYYLCIVELDTGKRKSYNGSLKVSTWPRRLSARFMAGDVVLLQDDHPLCADVEAQLLQQEEVSVMIGNFNRLGGMWLKAGAKRGRMTAGLLADYLLDTMEDGRTAKVPLEHQPVLGTERMSDTSKMNSETASDPRMDTAVKRLSQTKQALRLGLFLKELARRSDGILNNLEDLMDGRNLDASVKKALEFEIAYRTPLTIDDMKIPDKLMDSLLPPTIEADDGSFLSEYVKGLKK